jgi:predicted nucleic acid-binding protein
MTLVDTNVISDILSANPEWLEWSEDALDRQSQLGPLIANEVVYAELSAWMPSMDELDRDLADLKITISSTPKAALFAAGKAFRRYRAAGGTRTGVLPDLFVGAYAEFAGFPVLTRDPGRYRSYFPKVQLITP